MCRGVPDDRWDNTNLNSVRNIIRSNVEAVDESSLMIDLNSGQARQQGVGVSVSPASAMVTTAQSKQFTATLSGTTNQAVTWSVNGIGGGNGGVGYVNTSGLYSAPSS